MYCIVLYNQYRFDFVWRKRRTFRITFVALTIQCQFISSYEFVRSWSYYKNSNVIQPKYFLSDENIQEAIAIFLCCIYSWFLIAGQCTRKGYLVQRNFCYTRKGSRACIMNVIKAVLGSFEQLLQDGDIIFSLDPSYRVYNCLSACPPSLRDFQYRPFKSSQGPKNCILTPQKSYLN